MYQFSDSEHINFLMESMSTLEETVTKEMAALFDSISA